MIDIATELRQVETQLAQLQARQFRLRAELETRTRELGGTAAIAGVAQLVIVPATQSQRYDNKALAQIIADMVATGDIDLIDWARRIAQARQFTERSEHLRIVWVK